MLGGRITSFFMHFLRIRRYGTSTTGSNVQTMWANVVDTGKKIVQRVSGRGEQREITVKSESSVFVSESV